MDGKDFLALNNKLENMKRIVLALIVIGVFCFSIEKDLETWIEADVDYLEDLYIDLHQSPEISLQEKETSEKMAGELESLGFKVTRNFGGYGVVGIYENGDGPKILYRTDMDALPMEEKTGLEYSSTKTVDYNGQMVGAMHSCGHDMHMTTWVGTARAMVEMKDQWSGTLMLIGQPAEEIGAGAAMMLEAGLYEEFFIPDLGIGIHCHPTIPAGKVGVADGYTMAAVQSVDIKVFGVGAHGASPHMSIDPVVVASMMVMELQTIVSRNIKPIDDAVITVGAIKGGTKHNIIPDEVTLQLTIRTFTKEVRDLIEKRIREIARGTAIAAGLPEEKMPEITFPDSYTPPNYNNPELVEKFKASAARVIGNGNVEYAEPQTVGEDFSRYGQTEHKVPTVLFWLGTVPDERLDMEKLPGLHSPFYYPDRRKTIETGVTVTSQTLIDLFNGQ